MRRVALIEDDVGTREALAAGLSQAGLSVVHQFADGEAAIVAIPASPPDAVIVDLDLPGLDGAATIRALRRVVPNLPSLVLTVFDTSDRLLQALAAGAGGYILKGSTVAQIRDAVEQVIAGDAPLSPQVARHLLERVRQQPGETFGITARELEVLRLLCHGHTYAGIAGALGISEGTVQTHVKSIYRKMDVASKAEAAMLAARSGLLDE